MTTEQRLQKIEAELKRIGRMVQEFQSDFELVDAIAHSVDYALEMVTDEQLERQPRALAA